MFSSGNVSEKARIARIDVRGETVLDLYAGIGYWTLPFLVHGRAERVHACEMNPFSIEALRRGLHAAPATRAVVFPPLLEVSSDTPSGQVPAASKFPA